MLLIKVLIKFNNSTILNDKNIKLILYAIPKFKLYSC